MRSLAANALNAVWGAVAVLTLTGSLAAQGAKPADTKGPLPVANPGDQVLVKREAARLIDPEKYRSHLYLEPIVSVTLSAPFDGIVRQVSVKSNSTTKSQSELVRLENTVQKLQLARAQAAYKAASIEQKLADKKDDNQVSLASAKLEAAKAELDLAQHFVDQSTIRSPMNGEVLRVLVTEGQYVRAGDPLLVVGDLTKMRVEIPGERNALVKDQAYTLKVEQADVEGKIEAVLPLSPRFDPLRDLFESIACAQVVIENANGKYKPGQTVYVPLIPRFPVVEVPAGAIGNGGDGNRRVQVLRQWTVRDLPVTLMGPIGNQRLFVSGAFAEGDEVIYEASHTLPDGFVLKAGGTPATTAGTPTATGTNPAGNPGTTPVTKPTAGGF